MDTRKRKFVVAFVLVIGLVIAATPRRAQDNAAGLAARPLEIRSVTT
jgi:hypothetical protein